MLRWLLSVSIILTSLFLPVHSYAAGQDRSTQFRVYQNDRIIREFAVYNDALAYAKSFAYSHIERIGSREWLWDNFPRYKIDQLGQSKDTWEFRTLNEAIAKAKTMRNVSIRDLQNIGWVWHNYPAYRVYQGEKTLDNWEFSSLEEAKREAGKWSNSHIIDLRTNRWIWDNLSAAEKKKRRAVQPLYQVYQYGKTADEWMFAYLEDAVAQSVRLGNAVIVNIRTGKTVFTNMRQYEVEQSDKVVKAFVSLDDAIRHAKSLSGASIRKAGREIWSGRHYLSVWQNDQRIAGFHTLKAAILFAEKRSDTQIVTAEGRKLWNNFRKLLYLGWNGSSKDSAVQSQVSITQGMDIDSPTWFELADASGNLTDTSSPALAASLKTQGFAVHPLVTNQFDKTMTTEFLANPDAQQRFIRSLVDRLTAIGADGVNIDFESLDGNDRTAFTKFVEKLTAEAHKKRLVVSIDLPRGSLLWNERTAFDHVKLAQTVDYIITMTYDQHYRGSPTPGPVAALDWVEEGVKEFLSYGIPRNKLILGIPFYTREWTLASDGSIVDTRAIYMNGIPELMNSYPTIVTKDEQYKQQRVEYMKDGQKRVFWLEDDTMVRARIDIAKKYDLAGAAVWRLGYETADTWTMMVQHK